MNGRRANGQFAKGHVPANAGQRGTHLCGGPANRGRFRPRHGGTRNRPIGAERVDTRTGEIMVKIAEPSPYASHRAKGWHEKSRWVRRAVAVWRREVGPVPAGYCVFRLVDERTDDRIDVLCLIPRRVVANINRGYWHPDKMAWRDVPNTLAAREEAIALACLRARVRQLEEARG